MKKVTWGKRLRFKVGDVVVLREEGFFHSGFVGVVAKTDFWLYNASIDWIGANPDCNRYCYPFKMLKKVSPLIALAVQA